MNLFVDIKKAVKLLLSDGVAGLITKVLSVSKRRFFKLVYSQLDENLLCAEAVINNASSKVVLDVGAHFGTSLEPFIGQNFIIYAFEPDKKNREQLRANFPSSLYENLFIDHRAVSDSNTSGNSFYVSDLSSGISGLSAFDKSHSKNGEVDTITLKEFCEEKNITAIDYLKIDTEGFDLKVLQGVDFGSIIPLTILCEFEDKKTLPIGYTWRSIADFLQSKGYIILVSEWYPIKRYGAQHRFRKLKRYPCKLNNRNAWGNLVAVRSESVAKSIMSKAKKINRWKIL